jgi:2-keto-4-pentenoate hydratase/2-oxohepta-3-ene-1,7-dioic acid hydratase in catechol pathway
MKTVRFKAGETKYYGILDGDVITKLAREPYEGIMPLDKMYDLTEVKLLAPCTPTKIVALGLNYKSHAEETHNPIPGSPIIFIKPTTCIIGPEDNIVYPPSTTRVDYECELGVVIGKKTRMVSVDDALDYVFGYTCVNDVTARDHQRDDGQWTRGKGHDTFGPIGPCIETGLDPGNVVVSTYLNGELKQQQNTSDLIFSVPEMISFISGVMTLLPGDVIATGTPSGIGPMKPGDTVEIKIEPIGILRNYVIAYR